MAGSSLLALIDDIATILDDVSVMTKVAAKKTAGVLGDDLALNADQVTGVNADRELPVVWAVFVGALKNKLLVVPLALGVSAFVPWLITPLLMLGGAFLCFEGFEKVWHRLTHRTNVQADRHAQLAAVPEAEKIKGAVRTDLVLTGEIVTITLGTVAEAPFAQQVAVLALVGVLMTVGVYGFVAAVVKFDDVGLWLVRAGGRVAPVAGRGFVAAAPWLMKFLSIAGTAAMFLVGGGILVHGAPGAGAWLHELSGSAGALGALVPTAVNLLAGVLAGALVLAGVTVAGRAVARK
jgi:predicted DNA repair protein MutK